MEKGGKGEEERVNEIVVLTPLCFHTTHPAFTSSGASKKLLVKHRNLQVQKTSNVALKIQVDYEV